MDPSPLSPGEIDALLTDPRTRAADMLVLRDALDRMAGALERLADAVGRLEDVADQVRPSSPPPGDYPRIPPRAD